jgi:hypothetical protein
VKSESRFEEAAGGEEDIGRRRTDAHLKKFQPSQTSERFHHFTPIVHLSFS